MTRKSIVGEQSQVFKVIYPDERHVSAEWLIRAAADDVANGLHDGPAPDNVRDAIDVIHDTGTVTVDECPKVD